jgi:Uma2 family endonuclease
MLAAMSALRKPVSLFTAEEYLRLERAAESRSEYVNGEIVAMAGGTFNHEEISSNIQMALKVQLRDRPCRVFGANIKVRIDKANVFRYPDVSGLCGPILHHDKHHDAYCNPAVVFEVLSPSTAAYDRGEKFTLYRMLDTLIEYVLVSQERMEVEVWTRGGEGVWTSVVYNEPADSFALRTLNCTLTLAEIYERVEFGAEE